MMNICGIEIRPLRKGISHHAKCVNGRTTNGQTTGKHNAFAVCWWRKHKKWRA